MASGGTKVLADSIAETVGQPQREHVEFARGLRRSIPASLYDAAHSVRAGLSPRRRTWCSINPARIVERQFSLVSEQLGQQRTQFVRRFYEELCSKRRRIPAAAIGNRFPGVETATRARAVLPGVIDDPSD